MLARLARELPVGRLTYEPKWDGFRCLAFVDEFGVDLRSRHDRALARYFPEIVAGFTGIYERRGGPATERQFVIDGEILLSEHPDFAALMTRLHPAPTRVERLSVEMPARYVAFDVLADGLLDLRDRPFPERRSALERMIPPDGSISRTAATRDPKLAARWLESTGHGIDGVVAKSDALLYQPGRRAMTKVKRLRTVDCVVAGMRLLGRGLVSSLLLGLYDEANDLRHVGLVTQLARGERERIYGELLPLRVPLGAHPWSSGFTIGPSPLGRLPGSAARWTPDMPQDWVPLRPERVVEVGYDQVDGDRFRHPATFLRWRPDRAAASCRIDQLVDLKRHTTAAVP